ncbi:MAG TPA: helix-turn-helix domain-containing protein [Streptosporangiaceae bacterium]|nr:helix-turn-helix domain-containing protein [Streptosporangiaceae bacterium]
MSALRQEGVLAGTHEGEPGLPRGRSGLPAEEVRAAQRERLLRSAVAAVARRGFGETTVAEIVRGARVSKAAFYAHFTDKEDCFLAATGQGRELMIDRVIAAAKALPPAASAEDVLRAGLRAFLEFLVQESTFTRAFYIDMPAVGTRAVERIENAQHSFARLNRAWHERARLDHPDWPTVPYQAYFALAGATTELIRAEVRQGRTETMANLEDTLVCLHLAVLAARPWIAPMP